MKKLNFIPIGLALVALTASIIAYYLLNGTLMTTYDSKVYLSTAYNYFENSELITFQNKPLTAFPPLYPLVLSLTFYIQKSLNSVIILQIVTFFINGLFLVYFYNHYLKKKWVKIACLSITLFSSFYVINHIFVWSEGLFYMLSLLWFFETLKLHKELTFRNIISFIIVSTLLCMQRKTGFIFVITTFIFLINNRVYWRNDRIIKIITATFFGSLFTLYWRTRSTKLSEGFMFDKNFDLNQTMKAFLEELTELGNWIIPRIAPDWAKWILVLVAIGFIVRYLKIFEVKKPVLLSIYLFVIYSITIIGFMTFFKLSQTIDIRIMGSIAPFIILIVAKSIENFLVIKHSKHHIYALSIGFSCILIYNIIRTGYNLERWKKVETLTLHEIINKD